MEMTKKTRPTLGLTMIMKDEIDDLDRIIHDYGSSFDKVYVTVTDKKTYNTLRRRRANGFEAGGLVVLSYFEWIDHFGKARLYNQKQIKTDYWMWIDLDDEIEGVEHLPRVVEYMIAKKLDAVVFRYDRTNRSSSTEPDPIQWRERVIRTGSDLRWGDKAVHENIYIEGNTDMLLSDVIVKHRKTAEQKLLSSARNKLILENEWRREPSVETAQYLGASLMDEGDYDGAIEKILYVIKHSENKVERFRAWRRLSDCYLHLGQHEAALAATDECIAIDSSHPDPWYQKFVICQVMNRYHTAVYFAEIAMSKSLEGEMAVLLVNDPSLYEYRGPFDVAKIYLSIGNVERAYALYSEVKKKAPQYIKDISTENGVQWNDVFEQAYDEFKNSPLTLHDTRIKDLKLLVYRSVLDGKPREGSADEAELNYLAGLAQQPGVKRIAEIGFNAGMSSYAFLYANPDATVVSFDIGEYDYGPSAKDIIDEEFPGRHELILGDSTKTVPEYHAAHPEEKFDLIFIDGGHDYEIAKADIKNMRKLATKNTIVVTDDLTPWLAWGEGPYRAWTEAIEWGVIEQDEIVKDGEVIDEIQPPGDRIYARGRYNNQ